MATPENPDTPHSDTARVAEALHDTRQRLGRPGDAASDWQQAEKIVQSPLRTALFKLNQPLLRLRPPTRRAMTFVGQDIPRWIFVSLPQVEMVKLVALPLILATATSIITRQLQWEANQAATLDNYFDNLEKLVFEQGLLDDEPQNGSLVLARGRTMVVLQKLDPRRRRQILDFLMASGLAQLNEDGSEPIISLSDVNLQGMNLSMANLRGVDFGFANLKEADLSNTNLQDAILIEANLENALLMNADLRNASLMNADLTNASLMNADLTNANLQGTNLANALLLEANLEGAVSISENQIGQAVLCQTRLPTSFLLDPNRDCESIRRVE